MTEICLSRISFQAVEQMIAMKKLGIYQVRIWEKVVSWRIFQVLTLGHLGLVRYPEMNQAQEAVNSGHPLHTTCPWLPFTPTSYPFFNFLMPISMQTRITHLLYPHAYHHFSSFYTTCHFPTTHHWTRFFHLCMACWIAHGFRFELSIRPLIMVR